MNLMLVSPEQAMFTCVADGVPSPTISWYDSSDMEIDNGLDEVTIINTSVDDRTTTSTLTVTPTQPNHAGQYTCRASNVLGLASESATLTVNGGYSNYADCNEFYRAVLLFYIIQQIFQVFLHQMRTPQLLLMSLLITHLCAQPLVYQLLPSVGT